MSESTSDGSGSPESSVPPISFEPADSWPPEPPAATHSTTPVPPPAQFPELYADDPSRPYPTRGAPNQHMSSPYGRGSYLAGPYVTPGVYSPHGPGYPVAPYQPPPVAPNPPAPYVPAQPGVPPYAQPPVQGGVPYGAPTPYPYQRYGVHQPSQSNGLATAGLVVGIVSCLLPLFFGLFGGISGLIMSIAGMSRSHPAVPSGRGVATAGVIINILAIVLII